MRNKNTLSTRKRNRNSRRKFRISRERLALAVDGQRSDALPKLKDQYFHFKLKYLYIFRN